MDASSDLGVQLGRGVDKVPKECDWQQHPFSTSYFSHHSRQHIGRSNVKDLDDRQRIARYQVEHR
jgi:hypothetical protein